MAGRRMFEPGKYTRRPHLHLLLSVFLLPLLLLLHLRALLSHPSLSSLFFFLCSSSHASPFSAPAPSSFPFSSFTYRSSTVPSSLPILLIPLWYRHSHNSFRSSPVVLLSLLFLLYLYPFLYLKHSLFSLLLRLHLELLYRLLSLNSRDSPLLLQHFFSFSCLLFYRSYLLATADAGSFCFVSTSSSRCFFFLILSSSVPMYDCRGCLTE